MTDQPPNDTALRDAARYWGSLGGKAKSERKANACRQNLLKARLKRLVAMYASGQPSPSTYALPCSDKFNEKAIEAGFESAQAMLDSMLRKTPSNPTQSP